MQIVVHGDRRVMEVGYLRMHMKYIVCLKMMQRIK